MSNKSTHESKLKKYWRKIKLLMGKLLPPSAFFGLYLFVIFVWAYLYCSNPAWFKNPPEVWIDSLYFSVVTITTLGYGDITPITSWGRVWTAIESLLGVFLIGGFLMSLGHSLLEKKERRQIESAKANLRAQYKLWRREVVSALLFLSSDGAVDGDLSEQLVSPKAFQEYFSRNNKEKSYAIENALSADDYYVKKILYHISHLKSQIAQFVVIAKPESEDIQDKLTRIENFLGSFEYLDLDHQDDQKTFCNELWQPLVGWSSITGYTGQDAIEQMLEEI